MPLRGRTVEDAGPYIGMIGFYLIRHGCRRATFPKGEGFFGKGIFLSNFNFPENLFAPNIWFAHFGVEITPINPARKSVGDSE